MTTSDFADLFLKHFKGEKFVNSTRILEHVEDIKGFLELINKAVIKITPVTLTDLLNGEMFIYVFREINRILVYDIPNSGYYSLTIARTTLHDRFQYHIIKRVRIYDGRPYSGRTSNYAPAGTYNLEDAISAAKIMNYWNPCGWSVYNVRLGKEVYNC